MSTASKSVSLNNFRMMLHRRPLHPELFTLQTRRMERHGEYEADTWLYEGGHVVRFSVGQDVFSETVIDTGDHLPESGLVHALPCLGEKDYEMEKPVGRIGFVTSLQTENLADNIFNSTYREMQVFARETGSVSCEWQSKEGGRCMSLVDTQKYKREFHVQSYHLVGHTGFVLRTQSIFEIDG